MALMYEECCWASWLQAKSSLLWHVPMVQSNTMCVQECAKPETSLQIKMKRCKPCGVKWWHNY